MDGRSGSAVSGSRCLLRPFCLVLVLWPSGAQFPVSSCLAGLQRERMNPLGKFSVLFSSLSCSRVVQSSCHVWCQPGVAFARQLLQLPCRRWRTNSLVDLFFFPALSPPSPGRNKIKKLSDLTTTKRPKLTKGGKYFRARFFFLLQTSLTSMHKTFVCALMFSQLVRGSRRRKPCGLQH